MTKANAIMAPCDTRMKLIFFAAEKNTAQWTLKGGECGSGEETIGNRFLLRCIECRRDLAMRILSVCSSVGYIHTYIQKNL